MTDLCRVCGGSRRTAAGEGGCSGWQPSFVHSRRSPGGPESHVTRLWGRVSATFEALMVLEVAETRPDPRGRGAAARARDHRPATRGRMELRRDRGPYARVGGCGACTSGVYLVGPLETPHTAAMAAVLATDGIVSSLPSRRSLGLAPTTRGPDARDRRARAAAPASPSTGQRCTPPTSAAATASPSPPPPGPSSTSPPPNPPPNWNAHSTRRASSAASARIPSMSSSAVTRGTEERQH